MSWKLSVVFLAGLGMHAGTIVQYTFPGSTFDPTTQAIGVNATAVNAQGSSAGLQPGVTLPNSMFLSIADASATTAAGAVSAASYFQFTVTPTAGLGMELTSLTFDAGRGGASTPRGYVLRSSLDGFVADLGGGTIDTQQPAMQNYSTLLGSEFSSISEAITFRLYGYAPSIATGIFFDNLTLNGTVTGVSSLARYEFPGGTFAATSHDALIAAGDVNGTGSNSLLQQGVTYPNSMFWSNTNGSNTTAADAVLLNQYFQFSLASQPGFLLTANALRLDVGRGGTSTPRGFVVRSSADGYAADLGGAEVTTTQPNLQTYLVGLGTTQQSLSSVNFRIYGYSPSSGTGLFVDNLEVLGSLAVEPPSSPVPEPSTLLLLSAGLAAIALMRRR